MDSHAPTAYQLGKILRARRKELNLTQKEAAEKRGLLPKTISLLENETERCSLESFYKYLSSLDLKIQIQSKDLKASQSDLEW